MSASRTNGATMADALDLPNPARLTADQVRGGHCCWCNTPLTAETAVDLGERREPLHWFPRCCTTCIRAQDRDHVSMCETCVEEPGACQTAAALRQLVREHAAKEPQRRRRPVWCSWHDGLSDTALLVRVHDGAASGPNGGLLYACARCREQHGLKPLEDQP